MSELLTYSKVKDMPNPSKGLLSFLKNRSPNSRVWAVGEAKQTLKSLRETPLFKANLKVGDPDHVLKEGKGYVRSGVFSGWLSLRASMFLPARNRRGYLIGLGEKGKGVYMIDVTAKVTKALLETGSCALSTSHCDMVKISPRIKQCKYCRRKMKMSIKVVKHEKWVECK